MVSLASAMEIAETSFVSPQVVPLVVEQDDQDTISLTESDIEIVEVIEVEVTKLAIPIIQTEEGISKGCDWTLRVAGNVLYLHWTVSNKALTDLFPADLQTKTFFGEHKKSERGWKYDARIVACVMHEANRNICWKFTTQGTSGETYVITAYPENCQLHDIDAFDLLNQFLGLNFTQAFIRPSQDTRRVRFANADTVEEFDIDAELIDTTNEIVIDVSTAYTEPSVVEVIVDSIHIDDDGDQFFDAMPTQPRRILVCPF